MLPSSYSSVLYNSNKFGIFIKIIAINEFSELNKKNYLSENYDTVYRTHYSKFVTVETFTFYVLRCSSLFLLPLHTYCLVLCSVVYVFCTLIILSFPLQFPLSLSFHVSVPLKSFLSATEVNGALFVRFLEVMTNNTLETKLSVLSLKVMLFLE